MKKILTALTSLLPLILLALFVPFMLHAQTPTYGTKGLVQCVGVADATSKANNVPICNFQTLISTLQYIMNYLIYIAIPIIIVIFSYAGFLFMTANESNIKKAKGIFSKTVIGFVLMLSAWLIVYTILSFLTKPEENYTALLGK